MKSSYVELNGQEVHGWKKATAIVVAVLMMCAVYALLTAPIWLTALVL